MKSILVIDTPKTCEECPCYFNGICQDQDEFVEYDEMPEWCHLKPVHAVKSGGNNYIIYERQYLFKNLEREFESLKDSRKFHKIFVGGVKV